MNKSALLQGFTITHITPCMADPGKRRALANLTDDVSPVFVYLNATVPGLVYNPRARSVLLRHKDQILTIYPRGASVAKIVADHEAEIALTWFQSLCNATWQRRKEIAPDHAHRELADPVDVYELLPQLDCGDCGQPTCWAFALELLLRRETPTDCPHLMAAAYQENGQQLIEQMARPPISDRP